MRASPDRKALMRANKLINWMANYVGKMAPLSYSDCYKDLNEHFLYMEKIEREGLTQLPHTD